MTDGTGRIPCGPAVVLTREDADSEPLADALEASGVPVVRIPCTATRLRDPDTEEVSRLPAPGSVGALAFTSRRGVEGWRRWAVRAGWAAPALVAAVGRGTTHALEKAGIRADLVADPETGEALAGILALRVPEGLPIVLACGEMRAGIVEEGLRAAGREVLTLTVYANDEPAVPSMDPFPVAAVLVASPSAGRRLLFANPWMRDCAFVSIGPTTTRALVDLGVGRIEEADPGRWKDVLVGIAQVGRRRP